MREPQNREVNRYGYVIAKKPPIEKITKKAVAKQRTAVIGTGKKQLQVGENIFPISVTSEMGNLQRTYKVVINRAAEITADTNHALLIYPNPTDGILYIVNYEPHMGDIEIYDALGKLQNAERKIKDKEMVINISHFACGVYFLKLNGDVYKVVKE